MGEIFSLRAPAQELVLWSGTPSVEQMIELALDDTVAAYIVGDTDCTGGSSVVVLAGLTLVGAVAQGVGQGVVMGEQDAGSIVVG